MIVSEAYSILAPSGPTPPLRRAAEQRNSSEWHSGFSSAEGKRQHGRSWRQSRVSVVEAGNRFCQVEESSGGYRLDGCDMEQTAAASAYGASLAGRGFDFQKFVRQPQTIVRLLSWLFAMVVFACITTEGYVNTPYSAEAKCIFNQTDSACRYAVGIGVIAFLACVAFLLLDVYVPFMSNAQERKYVVMADMGFSGVWTFLWLVCFCLLASLWGHTQDVRGIPMDAARAPVAFSFFSIATWGILTYFAVGRFRRGVHEATIPTYTEPKLDHHTPYPPTYAPPSYNPTTYTPTTYAAYPSSVPDMHQQPPFTSSPQPQGETAYLPPSY